MNIRVGKIQRESSRLTWRVYRSMLDQLNDVVRLKVMREIVDKNPLSTQMKSLSKNELRYKHIFRSMLLVNNGRKILTRHEWKHTEENKYIQIFFSLPE